MTIHTTADGTRYRVSTEPLAAAPKNPRTFVWADGHICEYGDLDFGTDHQPVHQAHSLPAVPNWTLPSAAPQYLSDDPAALVYTGDTVAAYSQSEEHPAVTEWRIITPMCSTNGTPLRWWTIDCQFQAAFLLARADPKEDA